MTEAGSARIIMNEQSFIIKEGIIMIPRNRPKYRLIIDAAVDVIAEHGFHGAQVSKIAKQAGVADGTIYIYFKNKEDLLISVFKEKMGEFIERTRQALADKDNAEEKLLTLVDMHFRQLSEDLHLAIVTQLEIRQSDRLLRQKIGEVLRHYAQLIDQVVIEGQQQGIFQKTVDVRLARQMIFGTMDETVSNWVMNDHRFDLIALVPQVTQLLINGLSGKVEA